MKRDSWMLFAGAVATLAGHRLITRHFGIKLDLVQAINYDLKPRAKDFASVR